MGNVTSASLQASSPSDARPAASPMVSAMPTPQVRTGARFLHGFLHASPQLHATADRRTCPRDVPPSPPQQRRTTGSVAPAVISSHDKQNTVNALQLLKLAAFKLQPLVDFVAYEELIKLRLEVGDKTGALGRRMEARGGARDGGGGRVGWEVRWTRGVRLGVRVDCVAS
jgi:hypothetical protein